MTRKEQILAEASKEHSVSMERAFARGAVWADKTAKGNEWVSVKEAVPAFTHDVDDDCDGIKISDVVAVLACGELHFATYNQDEDESRKPYWFDEVNAANGDWLNGKVTHWLAIPEVPRAR